MHIKGMLASILSRIVVCLTLSTLTSAFTTAAPRYKSLPLACLAAVQLLDDRSAIQSAQPGAPALIGRLDFFEPSFCFILQVAHTHSKLLHSPPPWIS